MRWHAVILLQASSAAQCGGMMAVAKIPLPKEEPIVFGSFLAHGERQTFNLGQYLSRSRPVTEIETGQPSF